MMIDLLLALLLAILPVPDVLEDRCDLIEVNSFFDSEGRYVWTQIVFWDWRPEYRDGPQRWTTSEECDTHSMRWGGDIFFFRVPKMVPLGHPDVILRDYQVRAWRLVKTPAQLPQRDPRGGYCCIWNDGDALRVVRAASYRQTWTQEDVELTDRNYLPKEQRRELKAVRIEKPKPKQ